MISHKLHPMLSQELYFQIPVFEKINTHQRTFYYFLLPPKNGLNLPTLLADAVLKTCIVCNAYHIVSTLYVLRIEYKIHIGLGTW